MRNLIVHDYIEQQQQEMFDTIEDEYIKPLQYTKERLEHYLTTL